DLPFGIESDTRYFSWQDVHRLAVDLPIAFPPEFRAKVSAKPRADRFPMSLHGLFLIGSPHQLSVERDGRRVGQTHGAGSECHDQTEERLHHRFECHEVRRDKANTHLKKLLSTPRNFQTSF